MSVQKQSVFSRLELPVTSTSKPRPQTMPTSSNVKSRLGKRESSPPSPFSAVPTKSRLYSDISPSHDTTTNVTSPTSIHSRLGIKQEITPVGDDICTPTMVADTISKHSDVHARLQKKGLTVLPTKGPLGKRLGEHAVFDRLW